ncbi:MAG: sugar phosphate nucleotidyltransferase [Planctomycetota bacterium]
MKGVILAGGSGSRLYPLTKVTNKHLLPVYDKPMIYYPIEAMVRSGITDIMIVTGGNNAGDFLELLSNGKDFGLKKLHYTYQEGESGIAHALYQAKHFVGKSKVMVILADNIFEATLERYVKKFSQIEEGAMVLLKESDKPQRFGVAVFEGKKLVKIEEKPAIPKSNYIVTGIYFYDNKVFDIIEKLKPSQRGEYEITDVNNWYLEKGQLYYDFLEGFWTDAGTFESLFRANCFIARKNNIE